MTSIHTKKRISVLSIALGSLIMTSLGTGTVEALPFSCTFKCTKKSVAKDSKRLNECAEKCDNRKIMDVLLPNAEKLNEANQKHFGTALKYQQSIKEKEHSKIEEQLKAELAKPTNKQSKSKINDLNKKQDKLISEINKLGAEISKTEETSEVPPRPETGPRPSRPTSELSTSEEKKAPHRPMSGPHLNKPDINTPPSDLPPPFLEDGKESPYQEMPKRTHTAPLKSLPPVPSTAPHMEEHKNETPIVDKPEPEVKKPSNVPQAPVFGQNPRDILKAELLAQNPGKTPGQIDALAKQMLAEQYPGKSILEVNQLLKEEQAQKYPGKSHAEILEHIKAGGVQPSSGNPTVTPSKTTSEPSPQAQEKGTTGAKPQGEKPDFLSELGNNPMARLRKSSTAGSESAQYTLQEQEKKMLDRRFAVESDKIKGEIETSLQRANIANNRTDIAKYTAQLAYIGEKLKDSSDEDNDEWND